MTAWPGQEKLLLLNMQFETSQLNIIFLSVVILHLVWTKPTLGDLSVH